MVQINQPGPRERPQQQVTDSAMPNSGMPSMLAMGLVFAVVVIALAFHNAING